MKGIIWGLVILIFQQSFLLGWSSSIHCGKSKYPINNIDSHEDLRLPLTNVEKFVNILGGTDSYYDLSRGGTLPLITRPWAFNAYAPMTDDSSSWWFHPSDRRFFGLRVTHQPSPWIADYGNFLLKAYMPEDHLSKSDSKDSYTGYSTPKATFSPYYFSTQLFSYGNSAGNLQLEFSPSNHGGILKASFPKYIAEEVGDDGTQVNTQYRRISVVLNGKTDYANVTKSPVDGTTMITGMTSTNSGGINSGANFGHFFAMAIYNGANGNGVTTFDAGSVFTSSGSSWVDFDPFTTDNEVLTVRFATSFISVDQAIDTLKQEVPPEKSFEQLKGEAQMEWRSTLSRVKIAEAPHGYSPCELEELYTTFYSSLYRASVFPRIISEYSTSSASTIHWSPYATTAENRIVAGYLSTDSGFWDAWNTVYSLLSLANRPQLGKVMQGWVNAYKEGGWLPKWASPGYRGSMIGTMGDVSLAAAIVNDIPNFDVNTAYEAIAKDAFELPPHGVDGIGRVCLESYLKYGYVPRGAPMTTGGECYEIVSRSLNYLQSDYAIAQAATKLGKSEDANTLLQRSANYSKIFDSATGFFRSREIDTEKWTVPFDQYAWGGDYTESGPWQYRFYVPYDPKGLAELYKSSGRDMCKELLTTQTTTSTFHLGGYGNEIHEQTELPDHCWGQYAHNNQPAHYLLYMHMYDGYTGACSNQGREWIRKTILELYLPNDDMFPGDEDNGEMGAWFVLSALGLYERNPGSGSFILGIPLFGAVEIDISDTPTNMKNDNKGATKKLRVEAKNNSKDKTQVKQILWNGKVLDTTSDEIAYSLLAQGGTLTFEL